MFPPGNIHAESGMTLVSIRRKRIPSSDSPCFQHYRNTSISSKSISEILQSKHPPTLPRPSRFLFTSRTFKSGGQSCFAPIGKQLLHVHSKARLGSLQLASTREIWFSSLILLPLRGSSPCSGEGSLYSHHLPLLIHVGIQIPGLPDS